MTHAEHALVKTIKMHFKPVCPKLMIDFVALHAVVTLATSSEKNGSVKQLATVANTH